MRPLALAIALLCVVSVARAQPDEATPRIRQLVQRAMADYDALELEMARSTLMDAMSLARQAGLERAPVAARAHLALGVVYVAGYKDRNRGLAQLTLALSIDPSLTLDPQYASPELEQAFEAARRQAEPERPPETPTVDAAPVEREPPPRPAPPRSHRFFAFLMPGLGIGYLPAGTRTEVSWQRDGSDTYRRVTVGGAGGTALAPFHLGVELGATIVRGFSLSVLGRFQLVTGSNVETFGTDGTTAPQGASSRATSAFAGFVRARYRFLDGRLHPYVHLSLGGGEVRYMIDVAETQARFGTLVDEHTAIVHNADPQSTEPLQLVCPVQQSCRDSVRIGYLFAGGGGGLWFDVWKHIALILDVDILAAIPVGSDGQRGMNIDIQLGLGARFP